MNMMGPRPVNPRYQKVVLADSPVGYWPLDEQEGYANVVMQDGPAGFWPLNENGSYNQMIRLASPVGYWRFNGDGTDLIAGRNATVTNSTYAAGPLADGSQAVVRGPGSSINVAANAAFDLSTFTIEFWAKWDRTVDYQVLIGKGAGGGTNGYNYGIFSYADGHATLFWGNGVASDSLTIISPSDSVVPNRWYHIAVVVQPSGSPVATYVNGVQTFSKTNTVTAGNTNQIIGIGSDNLGAFPFNGSISELAIYNTALSAATIKGHYYMKNSTYDVVGANMSPAPLDMSLTLNNGTATGAMFFNQPGIIKDSPTCAAFTGSSYFTVGNASFNYDKTKSFSVECWANIKNDLVQEQHIISRHLSTGTPGGYILGLIGANQTLLFGFFDTVSGQYFAQYQPSDPNKIYNGWHHFVGTYNGNGNRNGIKVYCDGQLVATGAAGAITNDITSTQNLTIGRGSGGSAPILDGLLSNVAVYSTELSAGQVANHYAMGLNSSYSIETYAKAVVADRPQVFYRLGGLLTNEESRRGPVVSLGAGATWNVAGDPFGDTNSYCLGFDGTNAATATIVSNSYMNPGSANAATFEAWVYPDTAVAGPQAYRMAFAQSDGSGANYLAWSPTAQLLKGSMFINGAQRTINSSGGLAINKWYHLVYVYDGSTCTLYVNGQPSGTPITGLSGTVSLTGATSNYIGDYVNLPGTGWNWSGKIYGVAQYNTALTPTQILNHYNQGLYARRRTPIVRDLSVNNNPGTIAHAVALGKLRPDGDGSSGAYFAGDEPVTTTQKITIPSIGAYTIANACSIEGWIRLDTFTLPGNHRMWFSSATSGTYMSVNLTHTPFVSMVLNALQKTQQATLPTNADLQLGKWVHVVATWTNNGNLKIYVNGILCGSSGPFAGPLTLGGPLVIGNYATGPNCPWQGGIKDVALYNTELTAAQVANHFNVGNRIMYAGNGNSDK